MLARLEGIDLSDYIDYRDDMSIHDIYNAISEKCNELMAAKAPYNERVAACKTYREKFVIWGELAKTGIQRRLDVYNNLSFIVGRILFSEFDERTAELKEINKELKVMNDGLKRFNDAVEAFNNQFK